MNGARDLKNESAQTYNIPRTTRAVRDFSVEVMEVHINSVTGGDLVTYVTP